MNPQDFQKYNLQLIKNSSYNKALDPDGSFAKNNVGQGNDVSYSLYHGGFNTIGAGSSSLTNDEAQSLINSGIQARDTSALDGTGFMQAFPGANTSKGGTLASFLASYKSNSDAQDAMNKQVQDAATFNANPANHPEVVGPAPVFTNPNAQQDIANAVNQPTGIQQGGAGAPMQWATPPPGQPRGDVAIANAKNNPTGVYQGGDIASKFKQTLSNLQSGGTDAPNTSGEANAAIGGAAPLPTPPPYDSTKSDAVVADDKAHAQIIADHNAYTSSANQTQTLEQEYTQLSKDAGLPALNTQLLNTKKIMDGTEQDIRDEITKAGGFATESQVLGLTNARNKTMIQNYNNLLQTRDDAVANINTMIGLSKEDRAAQVAKLDEQLNFDTAQANFADKALANAQSSLQNSATTQGWDTVYRAAVASGDIGAISKINSTMGNGFDLYTMATNDLNKRNAALAKAAADAANVTADNARAEATLQETIAHNKVTETQSTATLAETTRHNQAEEKISGNKNGGGGGGNTTIVTPSGNKSVPTLLTPYYKTAYDGTPYVDLSSLTPSDKADYAQIASKSGTKAILDAGTAGKLNAMGVAKENLQNIADSLTSQKLLNDKDLPLVQGLSNSAKSFFGNADVKSFQAWRTAVINNVQALAGGQGSGLRINQAEIDTALKNDLPVLTGGGADNLSQALGKIAKLNSQLDVWNKQILGGGNTASQTTTSNTAKTKSGATFDVAGAKAKGYTDAEIKTYLDSH